MAAVAQPGRPRPTRRNYTNRASTIGTERVPCRVRLADTALWVNASMSSRSARARARFVVGPFQGGSQSDRHVWHDLE